MFRGMRRKRQLLPQAETIAMLESCTSGVLAVQGDDDYPYAVPLSYAYEDGKLFFHSACAGHKTDAVERDDKASFCVIAAEDVVQSTFTTHYRSAIVFGRLRVLTKTQRRGTPSTAWRRSTRRTTWTLRAPRSRASGTRSARWSSRSST